MNGWVQEGTLTGYLEWQRKKNGEGNPRRILSTKLRRCYHRRSVFLSVATRTPDTGVLTLVISCSMYIFEIHVSTFALLESRSRQLAWRKRNCERRARIIPAIYLTRNENDKSRRTLSSLHLVAFVGECFSLHRSTIIVGSTRCTDWRNLWITCPVMIYQVYLKSIDKKYV